MLTTQEKNTLKQLRRRAQRAAEVAQEKQSFWDGDAGDLAAMRAEETAIEYDRFRARLAEKIGR